MIFDTLEANDKNPNTKSQTLFFGIPKGTFYKKSTLAGFGAEPHESSLIAACSRSLAFMGFTAKVKKEPGSPAPYR
ncbi:MAG: hypothetical protein ACLVML_03940 [Candidatus Gastranaerophilaceae bacterium]